MTHPVTIHVRAGDVVLFAVDATGGMTAPATAADRLMVAGMLAQALTDLAAAPLDGDGEDLAEPAPEMAP